MNTTTSTTSEWQPRYSPWLIALPVMLATFMVFLDTSIVVVALPYVAGNLGATRDESTWVLTSYLVSSAIMLPASAWFASYFGRKRFLIGCTIVFTLASLLCGMASSMTMLVISRVLQGVGGGAMQPLSQSILLESFPPNQRGLASALFGVGLVVAPIVGPTLGGWLTDEYSWRWTFFINLPVGLLALFLMLRFVEDPPYIRANRPGKIDGLGFGLMALWLGTLQIFLDKGQDEDWFSSVWIRGLAITSIVSFIGFIVRELRTDHPIVNLRVYKDRNFTVSNVLFALFGFVIFALITLQPLFLQSLLGYTAFTAGLSVTPRGLGALIALFSVGALVSRVNPKFLAGLAFAMLGISSFMMSQLSLQMSPSSVVWANIISGLGNSIFVPLTVLAIGTLANDQIGNSLSILNLIRTIGGSVGLSYVSTMLARYSQAHQAMMVEHFSSSNLSYQHHLRSAQILLERHFNPTDALIRAHDLLYRALLQQASYWSFVNIYFVIACVCLFCVLCVFTFKTPQKVQAVTVGE